MHAVAQSTFVPESGSGGPRTNYRVLFSFVSGCQRAEYCIGCRVLVYATGLLLESPEFAVCPGSQPASSTVDVPLDGSTVPEKPRALEVRTGEAMTTSKNCVGHRHRSLSTSLAKQHDGPVVNQHGGLV